MKTAAICSTLVDKADKTSCLCKAPHHHSQEGETPGPQRKAALAGGPGATLLQSTYSTVPGDLLSSRLRVVQDLERLLFVLTEC